MATSTKTIASKCHWCQNTFVQVTVYGLKAYWCKTEACAKRQMAESIVIHKKGKEKQLVYVPTPKGVDFIRASERYPNVLFGGAAGGAKSYSMRWLAHKRCLQYPRYRVLLIRDKLTELKTTHIQEGLEFEEAHLPFTLNRTDLYAKYDNGSILQLGHLENVTQYLSTQYDLILPDELVTMPEREMRLLFSRVGRRSGVPSGVSAGSNPGGKEAMWVKRYFVDKDIDPIDDASYKPSDWHYIPSTVEDNPYLNPLYINRLLGLPEDLREAYLYGNWDVFIGQFFGEWRNRVIYQEGQAVLPTDPATGKPSFSHVVPKYEISARNRRICTIDWGYVKPGIAQWWAILPEGHAILEDEYVFQRTTAPDVAKEIAKRTNQKGLKDIRYVGDYEMWTPNNDTGEATSETFRRFGVSMYKADKDRKNGWIRLRSWFRASPTGVPWLRVMDHCKYTARTIPSRIQDERDVEDIDKRQPDSHPSDAARYFVMDRPHPEESARISVYAEGTIGAMKQEIELKRQRDKRRNPVRRAST